MQTADSYTDTRTTILLILDDDDLHPVLKHSLRNLGYRVLLAVGLEDAFDWLDDGSVHADIVLVDLVGQTVDDNLRAGRQIRQHAKYDGHTPLVVMPEKYGRDLEGTEVNVGGNDWIFYLGEEPNQLGNFLSRLLPQPNRLGTENIV